MLWVFFFITWNEQKRTKAQSCAYKTLHKCHQTKQIHIEKTKYNDKKKSQILKNVTNKKTKLQIKFTVWIGLLPPEDTSDLDQKRFRNKIPKKRDHEQSKVEMVGSNSHIAQALKARMTCTYFSLRRKNTVVRPSKIIFTAIPAIVVVATSLACKGCVLFVLQRHNKRSMMCSIFVTFSSL